jgi:hypothetical protein
LYAPKREEAPQGVTLSRRDRLGRSVLFGSTWTGRVRVGVVVEGRNDQPIFEELIPRIEPAVTKVVVRPTRGRPKFLPLFPNLLWTFEYVAPGGWADKAIVVCDANGDDPAVVEAAMRRRLEGRSHPPFHRGIEFHATRRETETWLLADVEAINRVAVTKGGRAAGPVAGPLEAIPDAKERFVRLLTEAGLPNVPEIIREVTREIDLSVVRRECPGFLLFEEKVRR